MIQLKHITTEGAELNIVRHLFTAYAKELNVDLCFQGFDEELKMPLKKYGEPKGSLLLAYYDGEPAGTIALQALAEEGVSPVVSQRRAGHSGRAVTERIYTHVSDRMSSQAKMALEVFNIDKPREDTYND